MHDYTPDDDIILLCNTQNVTVYELSNMKICMIKKYNRIITLGEYYEDDADMYEYLNGVIEEDEDASCYLKEYLEKLQSDSMFDNSKWQWHITGRDTKNKDQKLPIWSKWPQ